MNSIMSNGDKTISLQGSEACTQKCLIFTEIGEI